MVLVIIGIIVIACVAEWMRELYTFKVTHYHIASDKLEGFSQEKKIVFLSDLHNNSYGKNNARLIRAISNEKPDLILIGGDMLVGNEGVSSEVAELFVTQLADICPIYYANGNHEQRLKIYPEKYGTKYQEYKEKITNAGIVLLENEHIECNWENKNVQIHGLEIPREGYKKFKKTTLSIEEIQQRLGTPDESKYHILLAHNPIYAETYLEWGADLVLSGHLHGGVVRIPGLGGIITPQFRVFPKYSGEHTVQDGKSIVVSKGLGTHTIKIRFLNPAEIVVLHVKGIK